MVITMSRFYNFIPVRALLDRADAEAAIAAAADFVLEERCLEKNANEVRLYHKKAAELVEKMRQYPREEAAEYIRVIETIRWFDDKGEQMMINPPDYEKIEELVNCYTNLPFIFENGYTVMTDGYTCLSEEGERRRKEAETKSLEVILILMLRESIVRPAE